jgi:hypothetical protein
VKKFLLEKQNAPTQIRDLSRACLSRAPGPVDEVNASNVVMVRSKTVGRLRTFAHPTSKSIK